MQGIVSYKSFRPINSFLNTLTLLIEYNYELAEEAAKLYRGLRKKGITVRKPNDCLVATYAICNNALLQDDKDFLLPCQHSELKFI